MLTLALRGVPRFAGLGVEDLGYALGVNGARRYRVLSEYDHPLRNGFEVLRDSVTIMENIVFASANVEQDVELAVSTNNADIPDLKSIVLVILRECAPWLWHS